MNLAEALSELKSIKTRIARLIQLRKETIKYTKGNKPEKTYFGLSKEINQLAKKASKLKFEIMFTNATVKEKPKGKTIQELVFEQGDIRSELSALKEMLGYGKKNRYESSLFENRYDKDGAIFQTTRFKIEEEVKELEGKKRKLDARIQSMNWRTKLD